MSVKDWVKKEEMQAELAKRDAYIVKLKTAVQKAFRRMYSSASTYERLAPVDDTKEFEGKLKGIYEAIYILDEETMKIDSRKQHSLL